MWFLTSETDQRTLYVEPGKDITIGRSVDAQVCNFAIPDDPSISRKHATLSASGGRLYVQDQGSRYGTFVNDFGEKLDGNRRQLKALDSVRFGKMSSVWTVREARFVTCTSTLKGDNVHTLKACLEKLQGQLKNEWDESCEYLTMPAITLTIKVVLALAQGSHIVSIDFWTKCVEAINKQAMLPDPRVYTPQVVESTLNKENVSFHPHEDRKKIFAGKSIVFFSRRQMDMYKAVLLKCSATPLLLSDTKLTKSALSEPDIIVIQYNLSNSGAETQAQKDQITDITNYLKTKGKRLVADAEIGLAILYCSTTKYCNPDFNFTSEVIKQAPAPNTGNVLAPESQEPTHKNRDNVIINETLTSSSKRKMSEENGDHDFQANKKFAPGPILAANDSSKRKRDDDDEKNANKKIAVENDDNGLFNFLNNSGSEQNNIQEKKLNLKRPAHGNSGSTNNEDELFNFVEDESKNSNDSRNIFDSNKEIKIEPAEHVETNVDISAIRGTKLKELENANMDAPNAKRIKLEQEDLDAKMNDLDLGETILNVNKNLIFKKEPIEIVETDYSQRNYKKFKKVWPLHMHVTIVPKSIITIEIPDDEDETPAAACGTDQTETSKDIVESMDVKTESAAVVTKSSDKDSTDILKALTEQHGISDTDLVSHEPIDDFMSQAY